MREGLTKLLDSHVVSLTIDFSDLLQEIRIPKSVQPLMLEDFVKQISAARKQIFVPKFSIDQMHDTSIVFALAANCFFDQDKNPGAFQLLFNGKFLHSFANLYQLPRPVSTYARTIFRWGVAHELVHFDQMVNQPERYVRDHEDCGLDKEQWVINPIELEADIMAFHLLDSSKLSILERVAFEYFARKQFRNRLRFLY